MASPFKILSLTVEIEMEAEVQELRETILQLRADNERLDPKLLVWQNPTYTLLDVRREANRWEQEGQPSEGRGRCYSVLCSVLRIGGK